MGYFRVSEGSRNGRERNVLYHAVVTGFANLKKSFAVLLLEFGFSSNC